MAASRLGLAEAWGHINELRFNQDQSCFVCAMEDGLRVYNVEPAREHAHLRCQQTGSIGRAEMLGRTNLIAVVGGGKRPMFADNVVMIYDDKKAKMVLEVTLPSPVLAVRLKRDTLVAVCRNQIHVFSFPNRCQKLYTLTTKDNPRGLCEISPIRASHNGGNMDGGEFMVFPGYKTGSLQIINMSTTEQHVSSAPVTINAHQNELYCIAINQQGSMIASASVKGTLIRIWDTVRRVMLVELRRGSDNAVIYCINFSLGDEWLCCSSDKGTVHVFALQDYKLNKRSALATIGVPGAYAGSHWAFVCIDLPEKISSISTFRHLTKLTLSESINDLSTSDEMFKDKKPLQTVHIVCTNGSFFKFNFYDDKTFKQVSYDMLSDICENCDWEDALKQIDESTPYSEYLIKNQSVHDEISFQEAFYNEATQIISLLNKH